MRLRIKTLFKAIFVFCLFTTFSHLPRINLVFRFYELSKKFSLTSVNFPNSFKSSDSYQDWRNVSILCYVLTSSKFLETRTKYVKETWTKKCNKTLFISDENNYSFPTIKVSEGSAYNQIWAKTRNTIELLHREYYKKYDWFLKTDDDTFIIMDNLRKFLYRKNSSGLEYYGKFFTEKRVKRGYANGGAGYVMGNGALDRLINIGFKYGRKCPTATSHNSQFSPIKNLSSQKVVSIFLNEKTVAALT